MTFGACCDFFEKVSEEPAKAKKVKKLAKFVSDCRRESGGNGDLYPVARLLLPQLDRDRGVYGIKETMLAKLFVDMLKLGHNSPDALKLKNYRAPTSGACPKYQTIFQYLCCHATSLSDHGAPFNLLTVA